MKLFSAHPTGLALVLTWVALIVLAIVSWIGASLGTSTFFALAIAGLKALLIAYVFMELATADAIDRVVAGVAIGFVLLLVLGAIGDVAFR